MKKFIFVLLVFLFSTKIVCLTFSDEYASMSFSSKMFEFKKKPFGTTEILCPGLSATYSLNEKEPALPLFSLNVVLPKGDKYVGVKTIFSKKLLFKSVNIASNPKVIPTNMPNLSQSTDEVIYENKVFPDTNCFYVGSSTVSDINVARFLVCPFIYDSRTKELYFIEKVDFVISTVKDELQSYSLSTSNINMLDVIKNQVSNKNVIKEAISSLESVTKDSSGIDYLIITNSRLANSFKPLVEWKTTKGLKSKIVTIEMISRNLLGNSIQEKIKRYILDEYKKGLRYVLLGGDDTIIPVQYCYNSCGSSVSSHFIPSDAFYSCLNGDFLWNADDDNKIGEVNDNVDFTPSVFLTRLPVRTSEDVESYIGKLISYEKSPLEKGLKNTMLSMGCKLYYNSEGHSDSEIEADYIYNQYIKDNWSGSFYKLFDTGNNLSDLAGYDFTEANIHEQLNKGYSFVNVIAHGSPFAWGTGTENSYTCADASNLNSSGFSIITTDACSTNAFDSDEGSFNYDPCLSENLIRNPHSGVVSYWGCSREGWAYGPSKQYACEFYKCLFSKDIKDKNYGVISAIAKSHLINSCWRDNQYRWLQQGINAVGDPEMPIYTEEPAIFSNVTFRVLDDKSMYIDAGVDSATICVWGDKDKSVPYYKVKRNCRDLVLYNIPTAATICLTKQNYIPKILMYNPEFDNKKKYKILSCNVENNENLKVDIALDNDVSNVNLVISSITGYKEKIIPVNPNVSTITENVSDICKGIHTVALYVDDSLVDTKNCIK